MKGKTIPFAFLPFVIFVESGFLFLIGGTGFMKKLSHSSINNIIKTDQLVNNTKLTFIDWGQQEKLILSDA